MRRRAAAFAAVARRRLCAGAALHRICPKVYGEPMAEMPRDLYIPPDALEIILDSFEGPLDLLLYLIRKANINILDIPMAPLTAQYLVYVEAMRKRNLELAAEYLLMAAMLIEIKSRMLLPRPPKAESGEPEDPRAELVRRLIEYEHMKAAAAQARRAAAGWTRLRVGHGLDRRQGRRAPARGQPARSAGGLAVADEAGARCMQHHKIKREELSVREHMGLILRRLQGRGYRGVRRPVRRDRWASPAWWSVFSPCSNWRAKR